MASVKTRWHYRVDYRNRFGNAQQCFFEDEDDALLYALHEVPAAGLIDFVDLRTGKSEISQWQESRDVIRKRWP